MDCSLREASRKEQSIAPNNACFGPIRTKKRPKLLTQEFFWCFKNGLIFCKQKDGSCGCFRPCILGTFCRFIPCNLSRPRPRAQIPRIRRHPAQWPRGRCQPRQKPNRRPSGTTPQQPGRR